MTIFPLNSRLDSSDDGQVLCPYCADTYVHFEQPRYHSTENTSPTGERGSWINIPMWCESGSHSWDMILAFHKGYTFLRMYDAKLAEFLT